MTTFTLLDAQEFRARTIVEKARRAHNTAQRIAGYAMSADTVKYTIQRKIFNAPTEDTHRIDLMDETMHTRLDASDLYYDHVVQSELYMILKERYSKVFPDFSVKPDTAKYMFYMTVAL